MVTIDVIINNISINLIAENAIIINNKLEIINAESHKVTVDVLALHCDIKSTNNKIIVSKFNNAIIKHLR